MISSPNRTPLVAIVGNPNAGKTSLFNSLSGANQKVGNYPGVTVEKVSAHLKIDGNTIEIEDIPGLYSLKAQSEDERVALNAVMGQEGLPKPDLLVCVLNAANLERNLFLFTQLASLEVPVMVALTMTDQLAKDGKDIDISKLESLLGVPVVSVLAHKGAGIDALKRKISEVLENPTYPSPDAGRWSLLETHIDNLSEKLARAGMDVPRDKLRDALLGSPEELEKEMSALPEVGSLVSEIREEIAASGLGPEREISDRYAWAHNIAESVLSDRAVQRKSLTRQIDKVLTHRFFGLVVFIGIMYLVFQSIYTAAGPLMDLIEEGFGKLAEAVSPLLAFNEDLQSFVVDGLIAGVGGALVFLPQILILFGLIAILEGSGYLARAAFLMDRSLSWCGLNGRAFIPLLSSYACAIPGVMAARVMPDPKSRLATILVAPLMSCSARLPVYLLLIGTFIEPTYGAAAAGFALFAMHLLGLFVAMPVVYILTRGVLKGKSLPFLLELPPYQWPNWKDVLLNMYTRGMVFLKTAGTIIVVMTTIIWALQYYPKTEIDTTGLAEDQVEFSAMRAQQENSYLGQMGHAIEPIFRPAGFDWRIATSILAAFPAREVVVPSMGIIFSVGDDDDVESTPLRTALQEATWPDGRKLFTPYTTVGLMVFFALCAQCMATLAAVKRETNSWKWPVFMFVYMSTLAYLGAVIAYQIGRLNGVG